MIGLVSVGGKSKPMQAGLEGVADGVRYASAVQLLTEAIPSAYIAGRVLKGIDIQGRFKRFKQYSLKATNTCGVQVVVGQIEPK